MFLTTQQKNLKSAHLNTIVFIFLKITKKKDKVTQNVFIHVTRS